MLRRKPTAITVTIEDIATLEETLTRKAERSESGASGIGSGVGAGANANAANAAAAGFDPSDELKPLPGDKARIVRSREERIGVGRG